MTVSFRKAGKRIKETAAFTLAEALVAIIILLLVTSIVIAGIPAAKTAYDNIVIASDAEVLLSTTMSALRNELGMAKDIDVDEDTGEITYYNESRGTVSKISKNSNGVIMIQRYALDEDLGNATSPAERLVSKEASGRNLYPTYTRASWDEDTGMVTFTGLKVKKNNGSETPAKRADDSGNDGDYSIQVVFYEKSAE